MIRNDRNDRNKIFVPEQECDRRTCRVIGCLLEVQTTDSAGAEFHHRGCGRASLTNPLLTLPACYEKVPPARSRTAAAGAPGRGGVGAKREHAVVVGAALMSSS